MIKWKRTPENILDAKYLSDATEKKKGTEIIWAAT